MKEKRGVKKEEEEEEERGEKKARSEAAESAVHSPDLET